MLSGVVSSLSSKHSELVDNTSFLSEITIIKTDHFVLSENGEIECGCERQEQMTGRSAFGLKTEIELSKLVPDNLVLERVLQEMDECGALMSIHSN